MIDSDAATARAGHVRIGISGWTYAPWRGNFYPPGLPQRCELAHAASIFRSIEINGTFYRMQTPTAFAGWAANTPDDFIFAVKGPRFVTHMLRLRGPTAALANFIASGLLRLGSKLGPILWQFPADFRFDKDRLAAFFDLLPHDTSAAAKLGRRHDQRLKARAWLRVDATRPLRHAVEIRHDSFRDPAFTDLLRAHNIALVCADTVSWPRLMDLTADFVYCRLHGSQELYRSGYDDAALEEWAARIRSWACGRPMRDGAFIDSRQPEAMPRDVYFYFDNTDKLRAPNDAQSLIGKLAA